MEEDHYSKEFDEAPMPHSIFFTKIGHAIHGTDSVNRLGSPASHGCVRLSRENAAKLFALVKEQGVLNTTVTLTGSSQVALARNPRRANTAVARRAPLPQYEQQYDSAGDPVVITPPQQRLAPVARADDGYIYPADGSSNEARYPAPPSRRGYDTQAYQQQPQQQYNDNRGYAPAPQGYYYQTKTITGVDSVARFAIAGPGHNPTKPQPTPNRTEPVTSGRSMADCVGHWFFSSKIGVRRRASA